MAVKCPYYWALDLITASSQLYGVADILWEFDIVVWSAIYRQ